MRVVGSFLFGFLGGLIVPGYTCRVIYRRPGRVFSNCGDDLDGIYGLHLLVSVLLGLLAHRRYKRSNLFAFVREYAVAHLLLHWAMCRVGHATASAILISSEVSIGVVSAQVSRIVVKSRAWYDLGLMLGVFLRWVAIQRYWVSYFPLGAAISLAVAYRRSKSGFGGLPRRVLGVGRLSADEMVDVVCVPFLSACALTILVLNLRVGTASSDLVLLTYLVSQCRISGLCDRKSIYISMVSSAAIFACHWLTNASALSLVGDLLYAVSGSALRERLVVESNRRDWRLGGVAYLVSLLFLVPSFY